MHQMFIKKVYPRTMGCRGSSVALHTQNVTNPRNAGSLSETVKCSRKPAQFTQSSTISGIPQRLLQQQQPKGSHLSGNRYREANSNGSVHWSG